MDTIQHCDPENLRNPAENVPDTASSAIINVPTFEELYSAYHDYVKMRVCTLLHYRPDLIDDAIQQVWIKAWQALPTLRSQSNLKAWLWLIATNMVRDIMRHHKARDWHYPSLEATLDHFEIAHDECRGADYLESDPHDYIPEQVERQARRQRIWSTMIAKDKRAFAAYVENESFDLQDLYNARRHYTQRYKRAVAREQRQEGMAS